MPVPFRCLCAALGIVLLLASSSVAAFQDHRSKHATGECAKRGIPHASILVNDVVHECFIRGLHDYDCRQFRNPNPKDTPEACVQRRMEGGPPWHLEGETVWWKKPTPAPTPAAVPTPGATAQSAPEDDPTAVEDADDAGIEAADSEWAEDTASEEGGEGADVSGEEEQSDESEAGSDEDVGEVTSDEEAGDGEAGDEEAVDGEGGEADAGE